MSTPQSVRVTDPSILDRILRLRVAAWAAESIDLPAPDGRWTDEHDAHALHWAIMEDGAPIAAARMCVHTRVHMLPEAHYYRESLIAPAPIACLSRLVTAPAARGRGLSRLLDDVRVEEARRLGCRTVVLAAHHGHRLASLQRRGFMIFDADRPSSYLPKPSICRLLIETVPRAVPTPSSAPTKRASMPSWV